MAQEHTTVRLSDEGRARLQRLAQAFGSQTAAIEAGLELLERWRVSPGSAAPDVVLNKAADQIRLALSTIENELGRRAEQDDSDEPIG